MKTIIYGVYENNPSFYTFHLDVVTPQITNLDGTKLELLLSCKHKVEDLTSHLWYIFKGGADIHIEATETKDIIKVTVTLKDGAINEYFYSDKKGFAFRVAFGIRHKDYLPIDKENSPSLLDADGNFILIENGQPMIFPNISIDIPPQQEE